MEKTEVKELRELLEDNGHSFTRFFVEELFDYGIESLQQFEDSYQGQYESEADFVEQLLSDCYQCDLPNWVEIDYQKTWDDALSFDYFSVQTRPHTYEIFNQNF